ncbi:hypothetical protein GCM10027569_01170 [Flindersiella endophytica]
MNSEGVIRPEHRISAGETVFSVRLAGFSDLERITNEARSAQLSATWSSVTALREQVHPDTRAVICPLFRNGGPADHPESYRCHIWFVNRSDHRPTVSLVDIRKETFLGLAEAAEPSELRRTVRLLLDGYVLDRLA